VGCRVSEGKGERGGGDELVSWVGAQMGYRKTGKREGGVVDLLEPGERLVDL
jgi:hypothetical protein